MISLIICSVDEEKFRRVADNYRRALCDEPFEIIRVRNAPGMAAGYNEGFARSHGDIVIFSHDDVHLLTPHLAPLLRRHLNTYDVLGIAGTTKLQGGQWILSGPPYVYGQVATPNYDEGIFEVAIWGAPAKGVGGIKALDGVFLCARREVVDKVPFDERTFRGFHLYDIDFTFRAYLAGFKLGVCCDLHLVHSSPGNFDDQFYDQQDLFMEKHRAALDEGAERVFNITLLKANSLAEVSEVMTPPHWTNSREQ